MIDNVRFALAFVSALGSGLIAGVFFAFSAFVMKALARLPAAQGIAAMQSINVVVVNRVFLSVFVGTAAACAALAIASVFMWSKRGTVPLLVGSLIYLVGTMLVTAVFHIPRNDALAAADPAKPDAARLWADYIESWTTWNHVRTIAALAASGSLVLGLGELNLLRASA